MLYRYILSHTVSFPIEHARHHGCRQEQLPESRPRRLLAQITASTETASPEAEHDGCESVHWGHEQCTRYGDSYGCKRRISDWTGCSADATRWTVCTWRERALTTLATAGCWASQGYSAQGCAMLEQSLRACMDARVCIPPGLQPSGSGR